MPVEKIQYSFVPNHRETMMALARARLSSQEFRLVVALLNQTDGYLRDQDEISSTFWQAITLMSRASINHTLKRLTVRRVVAAELLEGKTFYRVNHPNHWAPEVFSAQCVCRRSIQLAQGLLSREKNGGNYHWLKRLLKACSKDVQAQKRVPSDTLSSTVSNQTRSEQNRVQRDTVACPNRHEIATTKESTKESLSKESVIGDFSKKKSALTHQSSPKVKPYRKQSGMFLDWVSDKEKITPANRDVLMKLVCRAARAAAASLDDLKQWYLWTREHDSSCRAREPPLIIEQIPNKLPFYLKHKREGTLDQLRRQNEPAAKRGQRTAADKRYHQPTQLFGVEVIESGADAGVDQETGDGVS
jgi:phage replication O-like protein O